MSETRLSTASLILFPNRAERGTYFYVPRFANVQRWADGRPCHSLFATNGTGHLMLTAEWRADDEEMAAAQSALGMRHGGAELVKFTFAPLVLTACRLLLRDSDRIVQLGESRTSGTPPFSAMFNVTLTAEQYERVSGALAGARGVLSIRYEGVLPSSSALGAWPEEIVGSPVDAGTLRDAGMPVHAEADLATLVSTERTRSFTRRGAEDAAD